MNRNLKTYLNLLWQSVLFWITAFFAFYILRYVGIEENYIPKSEMAKISKLKVIQYVLIIGLSIGIYYSVVEYLFDRYLSKRIKVWHEFFIKTLVYLLVLIASVSFIRWFYAYENNIEEVVVYRGWWHTNKGFWVTVFFFIVSSLIFSFIKIAIEKFGKNNFLKMLFGTYKNPKEEKRIFMFLDLKGSTTIAEDLGHFKYSQFIQDCFFDLNEVVPKYDSEIYQYVGDEAVLSWDYKKGLANNNCVELFFSFQQKLYSKSDYYQKKYGKTPNFKAGLHGGKLIVAEVGTIKKELAYHGDVINTSARIQAECNTYEVPMLVSEKLLADLNLSSDFSTELLGNVLLKGKKKEINIYSLSIS